MNRKSISFIVFLILFLSTNFFAASRYWIGPLFGNWSNMQNWSASSGGLPCLAVPGPSDVAIFDDGGNLSCTIDANANVSGVLISTLYSGAVSMNAGKTLSVGTSGFSQFGGTFNGNDGAISISGAISLVGGTFNSTTGTLQLAGGCMVSGGTFLHRNGTVTFSATQTIVGNASFYNILFVAGGCTYTIAAGTTITSLNNLTITGGYSCAINTGIVEIKGDLILNSTSNNSANGGSATFLFNGSGIQNINSSLSSIIVGTNERVCSLPNVEINKTAGALNLNGVINVNGTFWKTVAGASLVNPGTSTLNIISNVTFSGENLSLYDIHIYANAQLITLDPASYILSSTHNVIINGGSYYQVNTGILEILGDLTLINTSTSAVNGGTGTFLFDGPGIQNINSSAAGLNYTCALPSIEINKTSGALNITGILNFSGALWNTVAGASLINAGTSVVNLLKHTTLSGQNINLYDLTISGNFSITNISSGLTWSSSHLLTLAGGTSWYQVNGGTLNAKGDVLVTNTNTSNNVGGNAVLLFDGAANQLLTGSGIAGAGRLPQVLINKTGGTLTLSTIISNDNNWTYVAGNVDAITNATTLDFYKTSVIDGQGVSGTMNFYNVIFSGLISLGGNMIVKGDFNIRSGNNNRLDVNSTGNHQLNIAGNWINNNSANVLSFNQQSGKVIFDGTTPQTITLVSTTDMETFYKMEINNSSGLLLAAPITVTNNVNFVSGTIQSFALSTLFIGNAATATGASAGSFVSGPVCKTGNQAFTFPVGKNAVYAPIVISGPSLTTNQFTAEYFSADPNALYNVFSKDPGLDHLSRCEYWILDRTAGTSNVSVSLSWDTRSCGISNPNDLRIARWNGTQWKDHGNGGTMAIANAAGLIVSSAPITSFSPFTLASNSITNILPVELINFTARCEGKYVILDWTTATETNNKFYSVESSTDGMNWILKQTIQGAGTSFTELSYTFTDQEAYDGFSYYRLKQTDIDGKFKYMKTISIENCESGETKDDFILYSNPSSGIFTIRYSGGEKINSLTVFNSFGAVIYSSLNFQSLIDISIQPEGIYFVQLSSGTTIMTKKMIIKRME